MTPVSARTFCPKVPKSSKRKTVTRKSAAGTKVLKLQIKQEPPDIDLTKPAPPPSPTDDPILLHGRPIMRRSKEKEPLKENISSRDTPVLESSPVGPTNARSPSPTFEMNQSLDFSLHQESDDDELPSPGPIFDFSTGVDGDDGSSSDEGEGRIDEVEGEGEFTGRYTIMSVPTKMDPPTSTTKWRMETWGRPISPFPGKKGRGRRVSFADEVEEEQEEGENQDDEQSEQVHGHDEADADIMDDSEVEVSLTSEVDLDPDDERIMEEKHEDNAPPVRNQDLEKSDTDEQMDDYMSIGQDSLNKEDGPQSHSPLLGPSSDDYKDEVEAAPHLSEREPNHYADEDPSLEANDLSSDFEPLTSRQNEGDDHFEQEDSVEHDRRELHGIHIPQDGVQSQVDGNEAILSRSASFDSGHEDVNLSFSEPTDNRGPGDTSFGDKSYVSQPAEESQSFETHDIISRQERQSSPGHEDDLYQTKYDVSSPGWSAREGSVDEEEDEEEASVDRELSVDPLYDHPAHEEHRSTQVFRFSSLCSYMMDFDIQTPVSMISRQGFRVRKMKSMTWTISLLMKVATRAMQVL